VGHDHRNGGSAWPEYADRWGNPDKRPTEYVFNFFHHGISPERERVVSQNLMGLINDWMNKIAKTLGIPYRITTYSARHTHSNRMMQLGAPLKMIADNLGHTTTQITERHYLTEYELESKKKFSDRLLKVEVEKEVEG
jgi:integrase/recombinase XerD